MSLSASDAVTGPPTRVPAPGFSATTRVAVASENSGALLGTFGVTGPASAAAPVRVVAEFLTLTARSWKVYAVSLVSPVTVNPSSFAPPAPLFAICVQVAG